MGFLNILPVIIEILKSFKDSKMILMITIIFGCVYFGYNEVNAKHKTVVKEIKENKKKITVMQIQNSAILQALKNIHEGVKDVKESVKTTEQRVWQIGRDVYILKNKAK